MENMHDIVKLAVDLYHGKVENYSNEDAQSVLRKALIDANGGSTTVDYRAIRDGKCNGLFAIVEEILSQTISEELQNDAFFQAMVDFRNVKAGDQNRFIVGDNSLFVVGQMSDGTQGVRRQRLGAKEVDIPTSFRYVRIYEELSRVLGGRVDFAEMIDRVAKSFKEQLIQDAYALWDGVTADEIGGASYFPAAGNYDEDTLLDVIAHVEAAAGGQKATLIGTKKALRAIAPSIKGDEFNSDMYNNGYMGKFYGNPVIATPQRHTVGTDTFALNDDVITIVAGSSKPIKVVYEGESLVIMGDPKTNADLTQEYFYAEKYGMGLVVANNSGIGRYEMQ